MYVDWVKHWKNIEHEVISNIDNQQFFFGVSKFVNHGFLDPLNQFIFDIWESFTTEKSSI